MFSQRKPPDVSTASPGAGLCALRRSCGRPRGRQTASGRGKTPNLSVEVAFSCSASPRSAGPPPLRLLLLRASSPPPPPPRALLGAPRWVGGGSSSAARHPVPSRAAALGGAPAGAGAPERALARRRPGCSPTLHYLGFCSLTTPLLLLEEEEGGRRRWRRKRRWKGEKVAVEGICPLGEWAQCS